MGIFDLDEEDKADEELMGIISDIKELYTEIINGKLDELAKGSTVYNKEYQQILRGLEDHYNPEFFSSESPQFLSELIREVQPTGMVIPTRYTVIKRIERGLKTISRKLKIDLPEKRSKPSGERTIPPQVVVNTNQSLNNEIKITNNIKIEVDQAVKSFEEELNKSNPNPLTLKTLFDAIKKGAGHGTIKVIEVLLKKYCGIQ